MEENHIHDCMGPEEGKYGLVAVKRDWVSNRLWSALCRFQIPLIYPFRWILTCKPHTRPRIVCLCGSTRFYQQFQEAKFSEAMAGRIVLSVGFYPHSPEVHGEGVGISTEDKIALDELHKRKIDLSDEVLVLNVGGYIGESTRSEIEYARKTGKTIRFLEGGINGECSDPSKRDAADFYR